VKSKPRRAAPCHHVAMLECDSPQPSAACLAKVCVVKVSTMLCVTGTGCDADCPLVRARTSASVRSGRSCLDLEWPRLVEAVV
jgi:hypothetical protein